MLRKTALVAWLICFSAPAYSSNIEVKPQSNGTALVIVFGDIEMGDDQKFRQLTASHPKAYVFLVSNGGRIIPAIEMGKIIRARGYLTNVPEKQVCASACALVWLGGQPRSMALTSRIGFHASYTQKAGVVTETGVGNALVGRYLTMLGLSERAVIFITSPPPDEMNWIDANNAEEAGIAVTMIDTSVPSTTFNQTKTVAGKPPAFVPPITPHRANPDPNFAALFRSWKRLDQLSQGVINIPVSKPTHNVEIALQFGASTDRSHIGGSRHSGIDLSVNVGDPVYATADGLVGRAGSQQGKAVVVEVEHGRGIATLYGGLSGQKVDVGDRVRRGQLIGSAGKLLHYEVRVDGRPVNPLPFFRSSTLHDVSGGIEARK